MRKRKTYRVSSSLLNNWNWAMKIGDIKSFLKYLAKVEEPPTKAMELGNEYEKFVLDGEDEKFSPIVQDGVFQPHFYKLYALNDEIDVYIHGYLDVLKAGVVYDVKYTSKYTCGKYYESMQHWIYLYLIPEANYFEYLVYSKGEHYVERYQYTQQEVKERVEREINMLFEWFDRNPDYYELYRKNYQVK